MLKAHMTPVGASDSGGSGGGGGGGATSRNTCAPASTSVGVNVEDELAELQKLQEEMGLGR